MSDETATEVRLRQIEARLDTVIVLLQGTDRRGGLVRDYDRLISGGRWIRFWLAALTLGLLGSHATVLLARVGLWPW